MFTLVALYTYSNFKHLYTTHVEYNPSVEIGNSTESVHYI